MAVSGCGSVGRAVVFEVRSSNQVIGKIYIVRLLYLKNENKEKIGR